MNKKRKIMDICINSISRKIENILIGSWFLIGGKRR